MLTPSVSPPRPSTESSIPDVEDPCGPDLNRGISTDFNDVGGIYNGVRALIYFAAQEAWPLCKQSPLFGLERLPLEMVVLW